MREHKYEQLRQQIREQISTGLLKPGDPLPTERWWAETSGLARNTVRQTMLLLDQEGLISRLRGSGTYVAEHAKTKLSSGTAPFAVVVLNVTTDYYQRFFATFEHSVRELGRSAVIYNSNNDLDRQGNQILSLLYQHVEGVVLNPPSTAVTPPHHVRMLQDLGIPVVLLHRRVPHASAPVLEIPSLEIGRQAGGRLAEAGHRRVGFIAAQRTAEAEKVLMGLRSALHSAGAEVPEDLVEFGAMAHCDAESFHQYESQLERVLERMLSGDAPTALYVCSTEVAEYVYLLAVRMGLRIPDDLSIVCDGGSHSSGAIARRLTRITLDERAAAQRAVQLLVEMRQGRRSLNDNEVLPVPLGFHEAETLASPHSGVAELSSVQREFE
jgi:GntR family transcriptional regulator, arabinose operon transcriptional repressor